MDLEDAMAIRTKDGRRIELLSYVGVLAPAWIAYTGEYFFAVCAISVIGLFHQVGTLLRAIGTLQDEVK